jgi:hypothetical protein
MSAAVDALDLPIQFFALGTAAGMLAALIRHHCTGETDHWPVYIANFALAFFALGLLITVPSALGWEC